MYSFPNLEPVQIVALEPVVPCLVLTVASWPVYRSQEAGQAVWYSHLFKNYPQFVVIDTVKRFGVINEAKVDVFLEFFCFFDDPVDVGNLISGSSAFSKSSLNMWKFLVHILLKPGMENFEHYFAGVWDEHVEALARHITTVSKDSQFPYRHSTMKTHVLELVTFPVWSSLGHLSLCLEM